MGDNDRKTVSHRSEGRREKSTKQFHYIFFICLSPIKLYRKSLKIDLRIRCLSLLISFRQQCRMTSLMVNCVIRIDFLGKSLCDCEISSCGKYSKMERIAFLCVFFYPWILWQTGVRRRTQEEGEKNPNGMFL